MKNITFMVGNVCKSIQIYKNTSIAHKIKCSFKIPKHIEVSHVVSSTNELIDITDSIAFIKLSSSYVYKVQLPFKQILLKLNFGSTYVLTLNCICNFSRAINKKLKLDLNAPLEKLVSHEDVIYINDKNFFEKLKNDITYSVVYKPKNKDS